MFYYALIFVDFNFQLQGAAQSLSWHAQASLLLIVVGGTTLVVARIDAIESLSTNGSDAIVIVARTALHAPRVIVAPTAVVKHAAVASVATTTPAKRAFGADDGDDDESMLMALPGVRLAATAAPTKRAFDDVDDDLTLSSFKPAQTATTPAKRAFGADDDGDDNLMSLLPGVRQAAAPVKRAFGLDDDESDSTLNVLKPTVAAAPAKRAFGDDDDGDNLLLSLPGVRPAMQTTTTTTTKRSLDDDDDGPRRGSNAPSVASTQPTDVTLLAPTTTTTTTTLEAIELRSCVAWSGETASVISVATYTERALHVWQIPLQMRGADSAPLAPNATCSLGDDKRTVTTIADKCV